MTPTDVFRMSDPFETRDLPDIDEILADRAASSWLKAALRAALSRDPVDAANDSEGLARVLEQRCRAALDAGSTG